MNCPHARASWNMRRLSKVLLTPGSCVLRKVCRKDGLVQQFWLFLLTASQSSDDNHWRNTSQEHGRWKEIDTRHLLVVKKPGSSSKVLVLVNGTFTCYYKLQRSGWGAVSVLYKWQVWFPEKVWHEVIEDWARKGRRFDSNKTLLVLLDRTIIITSSSLWPLALDSIHQIGGRSSTFANSVTVSA